MINHYKDDPQQKIEESLKEVEKEGLDKNKNFQINKLLQDPLPQNKYFLKITLLQYNFEVKMEENIFDEIQKSYDMYHRI